MPPPVASPSVPAIWSSPDYAMDWPLDLVRVELTALMQSPFRNWYPPAFALLLREAFHHDTPAEDFDQALRRFDLDAGPDDAHDHGGGLAPGEDWLNALLTHLDQVRSYRPPPPLWRARQQASERTEPMTGTSPAAEAFARLVTHLVGNGYLNRQFPPDCPDDPVDDDGERPYQGNPSQDRIRRYLSAHIAGSTARELWPPEEWYIWGEEVLYELIEALHDVVSRPRDRWLHENHDCGWHFHDFDTAAGRRIYRTLVNRLLHDHGIDMELAPDGELEGRLVGAVDQGRTDLLEQVRRSSPADSDVGQRVEHAVAQFRRRDGGMLDKHSAVLTLAGILEERRALIRTDLGRRDEGALFQIANEFAVRHQRPGQKADYDPAFLDWVFWWYLGTVELTNRLIARDTAAQHDAIEDPDRAAQEELDAAGNPEGAAPATHPSVP